MNARTIAGVERERERERERESCISKKQKNRIVQQPDTITLQNKNWAKRKNNIGNKAGILQYALLNIHARDG